MTDPKLSVHLNDAPARRWGMSFAVGLACAGVAGGIIGHIIARAAGVAAAGPWMPLDRLYDVSVAAALLLLGTAIGWKAIRALGVGDGLHAAGLGLGILGTVLLPIGLLGLYATGPLVIVAVCLAIWCRRDLGRTLATLPGALRSLRLGDRSTFETVTGAVLLCMVGLALLRALMPPVEADAVTYHLGLPKLYLEQGRFLPLPHLGGDGYPFVVQLLYLPLLAAGSDIAPRLLHLALTFLTAAALHRFATRRAGILAGRLAVLSFLALPLTLVVGSWAYIDLAWLFFQVLALLALLDWAEHGNDRLLALAGLQSGLALGAKLLTLHWLAIVPLIVLWARWRQWRQIVVSLLLFGLIAVAVAAPWYLKNWLWYGSPVYPLSSSIEKVLVEGGPPAVPRDSGDDSLLSQLPLHQVLLPIDVFIHSDAFTKGHAPTVFGPLLVLAPLVLFLPIGRPFRLLLAMSAVLFLLWARGYQEARYFLLGATLLSLIAGVVVARLLDQIHFHRPIVRVIQGSVVLVLVLTAYDQAELTLTRLDLVEGRRVVALPTEFVLGYQSRESFLQQRYHDHAALQYVNHQLPADAQVLFLGTWAGGYYVDRPFLQGSLLYVEWLRRDGDAYVYPQRAGDGRLQPARAGSFAAALAALREQGVSYLFAGKVVIERTPDQQAHFEQLYENIREALDAGQLQLTYSDPFVAVLEITTGRSGSTATN